jgi:hypothetical protein
MQMKAMQECKILMLVKNYKLQQTKFEQGAIITKKWAHPG